VCEGFLVIPLFALAINYHAYILGNWIHCRETSHTSLIGTPASFTFFATYLTSNIISLMFCSKLIEIFIAESLTHVGLFIYN